MVWDRISSAPTFCSSEACHKHVFAGFANFSDEAYAREHSKINLYTRDHGGIELEIFAVDVPNASSEQLKLDDMTFETIVAKSDLVVEQSERQGRSSPSLPALIRLGTLGRLFM